MKKSVFWIVVIILVIIALGLGFSTFKGCTASDKSKLLAAEFSSENDYLYDSISTLNSMLDDCPKWKHSNSKRTSVKRQTQQTPVQTPVAQTQPEPNRPAARSSERTPGRQEVISATSTSLSGVNVTPTYEGSRGITTDENGYRIYFMTDAEFRSGENKPTISEPLLNGNNPNKAFYFDKAKNLWIYESMERVTLEDIRSGRKILWNAFIGMHEADQWSQEWEMYSPHEIAKTGSPSIRRAISDGEVIQHTADIGYDYASSIQAIITSK